MAGVLRSSFTPVLARGTMRVAAARGSSCSTPAGRLYVVQTEHWTTEWSMDTLVRHSIAMRLEKADR